MFLSKQRGPVHGIVKSSAIIKGIPGKIFYLRSAPYSRQFKEKGKKENSNNFAGYILTNGRVDLLWISGYVCRPKIGTSKDQFHSYVDWHHLVNKSRALLF